MAFLQRTVAAMRQGVVARLNLSATPSLTSLRGFAAASYLDKDEVVKRVTDVIKNFDRVDGSKVRAGGGDAVTESIWVHRLDEAWPPGVHRYEC